MDPVGALAGGGAGAAAAGPSTLAAAAAGDAAAGPSPLAAAVLRLSRQALKETATMLTPPPGVEDVFAAAAVLLAGFHEGVRVGADGRVAPADREWAQVRRQLLGNVPAFIVHLGVFQKAFERGAVPAANFAEVRPFLALPHFNRENIAQKSSAAAGVLEWVLLAAALAPPAP